jgi:hypothetical protein
MHDSLIQDLHETLNKKEVRPFFYEEQIKGL